MAGVGKSLEPSSSISLHNRKIKIGRTLPPVPPLQATYRSTPHLVISLPAPGAGHRNSPLQTQDSSPAQPLRDTRTPSPGPRDASCRPRRFPQRRPRGRANSAQRDRGAARLGQFPAFRSIAPSPSPRQAPERPQNLPAASSQPATPAQASPHPRSPSGRRPHLIACSPPQPTFLRGSSCESQRLAEMSREARVEGKAVGATRGGGEEGEDSCAFKVDLKTACKLLGCRRNAGLPKGSPQLPCPAPQSAKCFSSLRLRALGVRPAGEAA